jgi:hypothetical protein
MPNGPVLPPVIPPDKARSRSQGPVEDTGEEEVDPNAPPAEDGAGDSTNVGADTPPQSGDGESSDVGNGGGESPPPDNGGGSGGGQTPPDDDAVPVG